MKPVPITSAESGLSGSPESRMSPRQRFDAVLAHRKPDKLPFYFPTIACSVASELLGRKVDSGSDSLHFKEELSLLAGEEAHAEFVERFRENAIALNRLLRADVVRETWRSGDKPTKQIDENTLLFGEENGPHIVKRFFPGPQTYGVIEDTLTPDDPDVLIAGLKTRIQRDPKVSESELESIYASQLRLKALAEPYFPSIVQGIAIGIPMTSAAWLEATALEPEFLSEYFMFQAGLALQHIAWLRDKGYRFINAGADLASNLGPVFSPATFRAILGEPLKIISDECRRLGMTYCFRTDGNIWCLMDELFTRSGVQAYGEVDRQATMTVGGIRAKYPELLILGNVSSKTLCDGTEEEVRRETRASLEESRGLNYIAGPSNAIVHGTPARNVWAMIEEIEGYRPS